jgi:hypothetical protein
MPHASRSAPPESGADLAAVARFLRGLAERVERDPAFGQQIAVLLAQAGLVPDGIVAAPAPVKRAAPRTRALTREEGAATEGACLDPFGVLREAGEEALRARLGALPATGLHDVIRTYRLDPARISVRWTSQPRLVELIVEQVRARADHGKAFARV